MKSRKITLASGVLALTLAAGLLGGCSSGNKGPIVTEEIPSKENTSTLSPLEYGKVRREALRDTDVFIKGWKASDPAAMRKVAPDAVVKLYEKTWDGYADQGLKIKHVHKVSAYDLTQFNNLATQATIAYTYKDYSYLVDENGKKVKDLPVIDEDASITIERKTNKSDEWKIVRMFMDAGSYR